MKLSTIFILVLASYTLGCNEFSAQDHIVNHQDPMVLAAQTEIGGMFNKDYLNLQASAANHGTAPTTENAALTNWHNVRLFFDYSNLGKLKDKDQEKYNYLTRMLMPILRDYVYQTLKVQEKAKIQPAQQECAGAYLSNELMNKHTQSDLILLVSADGDIDDDWVAFSAACQINEYTGRPTIGRINFNPYYLNTDFDLFFDSFGMTFHELTHVMVFAENLWPYYIDWTAGARRGVANVATDITASGVTWKAIKTPRVQAFTRSNFGCNTLEGAALENNMTSGTKNSHWEKEFFGNEYMTSATAINPVITDLTWALFIDSGWYQFNEDSILDNGNQLKVEPLSWLLNEGCGVYGEQCPKNGVSCTKVGEAGCAYDNVFQGSCKEVSSADRCQWYKATNYWDQDCRVATNMTAHQLDNMQSFGVNRRCFTGDFGKGKKALCYLPKCTKTGTHYELQIQVGGEGWLTCVSNGGTVAADYTPQGATVATKGNVTCPKDIEAFCTDFMLGCPNDCNNRGRCMKNGKCMCYSGFTGVSCGDVLLNGSYVNSKGGISTTVAVQGCPYNGGISQHACENGVCVSSLGYCMCYLNYQGHQCDKGFHDYVTGGYYYANIASFGMMFYVLLNLYIN